MNKVILVLADALRYDVARDNMGFLCHLVETKQASLYKMIGELPSMSRPMYETVHTGVPSSVHAIVANSVVRLSRMPNVFQSVRKAGGATAAAAYCWVSELYNQAPYDPINHKEVDNRNLTIQHGRFYTEDDYPDRELFRTAALLVRKFSPNYMLVHPMGLDYRGETFGSDTKEYRNHVTEQDSILAPLLVEWRELRYTVLVTGDHGINRDGSHGGSTPEQREVPLYIVPADGHGKGDTGETVSQLQLAPTILKLLNLSIPETMKQPALT
jgi:predicted AlkP superfamily pyrophosphatase or phosphodiesterase